jgi:hypothetical protein
MLINHWFSNAQTIATESSGFNCTNVFDTGVTGGCNAYDNMWIVCQVETVFATAGGNPTMTFALVTSADAALGTPTTLHQETTVAEATLVDKYVVFKMRLPRISQRYVGLIYTPSAAFDSGKIDAYMTDNVDYLT